MTPSTDTWPGAFLRFLLPALYLLSALTLGGCDGAVTPEPTPMPTPTPTPLPLGASVPARIRARGYLVVGVRYDLPPFGYVDDDGALAGFDVDLGRELARRWLGDSEAVRFRQVRSDTAVEHILAGDVDLVLTVLLHAQDLEAQVDFGPPLFEDGQALLVRAGDVQTITAPADLEGRMVGVVSGAEAEEALLATVPFTPTLVTYATFDQALTALARGEVSVLADLRRRLVRGLFYAPGTVAVVGRYNSAVLAPAYAPNEPGMADLVALTLQDVFADGTFQEFYARWFPGDWQPEHEFWPGAATASLETAGVVTRAPDTIAAIQERGRLSVAMVADCSPFAYLAGDEEPAGYEVHLVRTFADRWLGDRTAVDFLPVTLEEGLAKVAGGEVDLLIGAVVHTREAELQVDFSLTTYMAGEGLMVRSGVPLGGVSGLDGQTVAAVAGTGSADVLLQAAQQAGVSVTVVPKPTLEEAMAALEAGEVAAVVGERVGLLGPSYLVPGIGVTADRLTQVPLALALPPGDSAFRDLVNLTLQAMNWEGQLASVYWDWFDDEPPMLPPWPGELTIPLRIEVTPPE